MTINLILHKIISNKFYGGKNEKIKKLFVLVVIFCSVLIFNSNKSEAANPTQVLFDRYYYIQRNQDVYKSLGSYEPYLLNHFYSYGVHEGRIASIFFDLSFYKATYPDLVQAFGNNNLAYFEHYLNYGMQEGRICSAVFDINYYKRYEDLPSSWRRYTESYYWSQLYSHFLNYGIKEGRGSSLAFDAKYYLNSYSDLKRAFGNNYKLALQHYLKYGILERRLTSGSLSVPLASRKSAEYVTEGELNQCIVKVPLTSQNWQNYFYLEEKNNKTYFYGKDKNQVKTYLKFEFTNRSLIYDWYTGSSTDEIYHGDWFYFPYLKDQWYISLYNIRCISTKGNIYVFDIPNNYWNFTSTGRTLNVFDQKRNYSRSYNENTLGERLGSHINDDYYYQTLSFK